MLLENDCLIWRPVSGSCCHVFERWVAGEERIDQHRGAAEIETECGMAVPSDLHGACPLVVAPEKARRS